MKVFGAILTLLIVACVAGTIEAAPVVQATITWQYNPAETQPVTGVKVLRRVGLTGNFTLLNTVAAPGVSYLDTGLTLGTTYCYQVAPTNNAGDGPVAPPTGACVPLPSPPTQPLIPGGPGGVPPFISVTIDGVTVTITVQPGP